MGSDKLVEINYDPAVEFQSTLPHGERLPFLFKVVIRYDVSIHAPTWGATYNG